MTMLRLRRWLVLFTITLLRRTIAGLQRLQARRRKRQTIERETTPARRAAVLGALGLGTVALTASPSRKSFGDLKTGDLDLIEELLESLVRLMERLVAMFERLLESFIRAIVGGLGALIRQLLGMIEELLGAAGGASYNGDASIPHVIARSWPWPGERDRVETSERRKALLELRLGDMRDRVIEAITLNNTAANNQVAVVDEAAAIQAGAAASVSVLDLLAVIASHQLTQIGQNAAISAQLAELVALQADQNMHISNSIQMELWAAEDLTGGDREPAEVTPLPGVP